MNGMIKKFAHFCQRLCTQIALLPKYIDNFGIKVALYIIVDRIFPPGRSKRYRKIIYNYLYSEFHGIVERHINENRDNSESSQIEKSARIIWVCWFQGKNNMPELVSMCYRNLQRKITGTKIKLILLTHNNIDKYIDIPIHIKEKYHSGIISNAHYSDIVRFKVLRKYGGCWMDATIFATDNINHALFEKKFHTLKMHPQLCPMEPCMGLWSGFFIVGHRGLSLFKILDDCLDIYWQNHNIAIDYIMFDYMMLVAYRNHNDVRITMDSVPYNNEELWYLWNNIEEPFDDQLYRHICNKGQFYKLSYQKKLKKEVLGRQSVYGYLTSK